MDTGRWTLQPAIEGAGWPPALAAVLEAAIRLGVEAPDRPIPFGLQPVLELALLLVTDTRIRELNREHRGIDGPTDVLSFSQIEGSGGFVAAPSGRLALGDVVVSLDTARRQAAEFGHELDYELCLLAAHGALHLLGYDHQTDEDLARMNALTREALASARVCCAHDRRLD